MSAVFSEDRTRRYLLTRQWEPKWMQAQSKLGFVMLNPSIAGEDADDPTVRKCCGFAKRWGFTSLAITNLIPIISTDPWRLPPWEGLFHDNHPHLKAALDECSLTIVAWGSLPRAVARTIAFAEHLRHFREIADGGPLFCIGRTSKGDPLHPSRAPYWDAPERWDWE